MQGDFAVCVVVVAVVRGNDYTSYIFSYSKSQRNTPGHTLFLGVF